MACFTLGAAFIGLAWLCSGVTAADASLVASVPADGETLVNAPDEIRIQLSEPFVAADTTLDLVGASGGVIASHVGAPQASDPRVLVASLVGVGVGRSGNGMGARDPADPGVLVAPDLGLADGAYTVVWRATSRIDGLRTSGSFGFRVDSAGGSDRGAANPGLPVLVGLLAIGAIAAAAGLARRRRP
jgi:methionine-rich copper-binding protein CopC